MFFFFFFLGQIEWRANILTTLACTIFFCVAADPTSNGDVVDFCWKDDAAAAETPNDR